MSNDSGTLIHKISIVLLFLWLSELLVQKVKRVVKYPVRVIIDNVHIKRICLLIIEISGLADEAAMRTSFLY